jgi:hypothetical protein
MVVSKIRGALGTQVMCLAIDIAEHEDNIDTISYNLSGYNEQHLKMLKLQVLGVEFLDRVLDLSFSPEYVKGPGPSLNNKKIEFMLQNRDKVLKYSQAKKYDSFDGNVLHVRKWDSDLLDDDDYFQLIEKYNCKYVITDDAKYCERFNLQMNEDPENEVIDWLMLCNSDVTCVGPFSTFTLLAAFYNKKLNMKVCISEKNYDGRVWGGNGKENINKEVTKLFVKHLSNVNYA